MTCPMIGVAGSIDKEEQRQSIVRDYLSAIAAAGGLPVMLSYDMTPRETEECVRRMDGLMLAGGNDLGPEWYGQPPAAELGEVDPLRDKTEFALVKAMAAAGKPIFGICRGIQTLNAAFGGTLYQDLPTQYRPADGAAKMSHQQTRGVAYASHKVAVQKDTLLFRILRQETVSVNSFHHQAVCKIAPDFLVSATAEDGVVEAVEHKSLPFVLGVQWHPERMHRVDPQARALFEAFVQASAGSL